jgi:glutathione S-transferase
MLRLAPQRPLLPASSEDRALVIGISAELCGEWGFGWVRRTMMGAPQLLNPKTAPPPAPFTADEYGRMRQSYSVSIGGPEEAAARAADILRMLAKRLHAQKKVGSPYFVGSDITACDIYWTVFSMALEPLPDAVNPMPDWMRRGYELIGPTLEAARDPILLEHRDMVYNRHLKLPLEF